MDRTVCIVLPHMMDFLASPYRSFLSNGHYNLNNSHDIVDTNGYIDNYY